MSRKERSHKLKSDDLDDQERRAEETDDKELRRTKVEEREVAKLIEAYKNFDPHAVKLFKDFPLSGYTRSGLSAAKYEVPTDIQRESIGYALKGQDVLGAAKTGSGKTLAFIIPLLECLYRERWSRFDGVGALVITPTRELAMQIFDVINKVGKFHDFSVALVIGGKDLKFERKRMDRCNIVICTPGRLLQHMNENYLLNCDNLRILILDEADRILDLGFAQTMNAIIEYLPHDRQTLLFSATQTKSVKDLARLSLKDPVYVSVHENAIVTTPDALVQSYIVCELHEKMNVLYSFIRNHRSFKIIVFLSTCKQVKFVYDFFCDMRPGISLLALYGTLHQMRRMQIYNDFCHKQRAVLFATDIASRGLDFPDVNWVVQFDCPEDVDTYIHRAGRTARYQKGGESLLFLLPSEEESMVHHLRCRKIPITKIEVDPSKIRSIQRKAEEFCARRVSQKETAQRAFKAYVKNCFLMKDKSVFNLDKLNLELFSKSLGLVISPRLRFVERAKAAQNQQKKGAAELVEKQQCERQKKQMSLQESINFRENSDDEDDDLFTVKKVEDSIDLSFGEVLDNRQANKKTEKIVSKASTVKRLLKKNIKPNSKIIFDDDGNPIEEFPKAQKSEKAKEQLERVGGGIDIELAKEIMKEEDKVDKQIYREMIKAKHREKRKKLKEKRRKDKNETTAKITLTEDTSEVDEANEGEINEGETLEQYIDELPDPDRIYGGKVDEESDQDSSNYHDSNESMEEEDDEESLNDDVFSRKRKRRRYSNDSERMEAGLDLDNAEELALQLIKS